MPETQPLPSRGSNAQLLRRWGIGLVVASVFSLGVIPAGDRALMKMKTDVGQLVRQTTWEQALANEPASSPWPWEEIVMPAEGLSVPRLGLSAAVMHASKDDEEPSRPVKLHKTSALAQDPHLIPDSQKPHIAVNSDVDDRDDLDFGCQTSNCAALSSGAPVKADPVVDPHPSVQKQL